MVRVYSKSSLGYTPTTCFEGVKKMAFDEDEIREEPKERPDYDWREYGDHDQAFSQSLEGKDIIAIFIAALQTIFLPLVILGAAMLIIGIAIGLIFS